MQRALTKLLVFLAVLLVARAGAAAERERTAREKEHEAKIVDALQARNPEAVVVFLRANKASDDNDLQTAVDEYGRVLSLAPGFTPAMRRRAIAMERLGQRKEALDLARKALKAEDSSDNELALAIVLLGHHDKASPPPDADVREALRHAERGASMAADDPDTYAVLCEAALSARSESHLQTCSSALLRLAPEQPHSHVYASLAALTKGETSDARREAEEAKRLGADPQIAAKLVDMADENTPFYEKWGPPLGKVVVAWLAGLVLLLGLGVLLSQATLRLVRTLTPDDESQSQGALLRRVYNAVLHLSCFYYYLSLPLVLLLVLVVGGGLIVGFFMIGHIPIKLVAIIGVLVLVTIWSVLKSLFVRPKDMDPGTPVDLKKNPKLAAVLEEVAARVGTRQVDTVYMTPHTEIAVLERGGLTRQIRGNTERCLVLGVGVLDGMKLAPFKAILAHEYGHFSNRDTAGGGFAIAVRRSLLLTAVGLAQGGAAGWYNPAWLFLLGFQKVFLRVSQGASRLQEVMADRWAAFSYGPEVFVRGLKHVIRRTIEFEAHVQSTIHEVVANERPLTNLYGYCPEKKPEDEEIDQAVEESIHREPSPYDSHPRPADRIAWVRELATSAAPREDDETDVWELFADRAALEAEMTDEVRTAVLVNHGVEIKREEPAAAAS
jgi:Zn-dependent protease with chaperone function